MNGNSSVRRNACALPESPALWPCDRGNVLRQRLALQVRHELPDNGVGKHGPVGGHAVRATIANRLEYRRVIASEAPAAVHQAWTNETKAARAVASVAIHDVEKDFPLAGNIRISANGFRGFVSRCNAGRRGQHGHHHAAHAAHSANTHTMPPWLVY